MPEQLGDGFAPAQHHHRLVRADRHRGDDGDLRAQREPYEAEALTEVDPVPLWPRAEDVVVTAGIVDQDAAVA